MSAEDEDVLLARAAEERERIFQRYERGREPGAEIDPWEDPGFEVYHAMDRYGFIHDKRLPRKDDPNEAKSKQIEMERVKKWVKMLAKWDSAATKDKLHRRVYKGIPNSLRSQVWCKLLDLANVKEKHKGVYSEMLSAARKWSTDVRQIDSDVNRQFRDNIAYRDRYCLKQKEMFNVLTAYGMYNMEVGYCQGMSGIAGMLLMYMDEEDAFWALSVLLSEKKYAMHGLYIEGFPKLSRFLEHHDRILNKFMPKLKKHFDTYGLDAILYSLKWFFVCFVERVPFSLCLRIWDIYLLDGERAITGMAYTILKMHRRAILRLSDMDRIVQYIQVQLHKDFGYDDDTVITTLERNMEELRKAKLDLPGPPQPHELPRRKFGEFREQSFERKVGRRTQEFTPTEKNVTEGIVLRREKAASEALEARISAEGLPIDGSGGILSGPMPADLEESGSLLGCSRHSLADTSVTSTADLSVLSAARSQALDNSLDTHSYNSEGSGSPGSNQCSLSIARAPSASLSTPRATPLPPIGGGGNPTDIVRIYVPGATSSMAHGSPKSPRVLPPVSPRPPHRITTIQHNSSSHHNMLLPLEEVTNTPHRITSTTQGHRQQYDSLGTTGHNMLLPLEEVTNTNTIRIKVNSGGNGGHELTKVPSSDSDSNATPVVENNYQKSPRFSESIENGTTDSDETTRFVDSWPPYGSTGAEIHNGVTRARSYDIVYDDDEDGGDAATGRSRYDGFQRNHHSASNEITPRMGYELLMRSGDQDSL